MSEDVSDQSLLDIRGLDMCQSIDDSALGRVLQRILTQSAEASSNSFQACI
jgi:hypothetical protein